MSSLYNKITELSWTDALNGMELYQKEGRELDIENLVQMATSLGVEEALVNRLRNNPAKYHEPFILELGMKMWLSQQPSGTEIKDSDSNGVEE